MRAAGDVPGLQGQLRKALASANAAAEGGACRRVRVWLWRMKSPAYICFPTRKVSSTAHLSILDTTLLSLFDHPSVRLSACLPACPAYASVLIFELLLLLNCQSVSERMKL